VNGQGRVASWLAVALIAVMTYEVTMRFAFNAPTMWGYETAMMLGGVLAILAWSYVHRHDAHLRVDVLYRLLPHKGRAIIDVIGALLCFFPLVILLSHASIVWAWESWATKEKMVETYWYPPAGPFRTLVAIGVILFLLQGTIQFIRDSYFLIRGKSFD